MASCLDDGYQEAFQTILNASQCPIYCAKLRTSDIKTAMCNYDFPLSQCPSVRSDWHARAFVHTTIWQIVTVSISLEYAWKRNKKALIGRKLCMSGPAARWCVGSHAHIMICGKEAGSPEAKDKVG